MMKFNEDKLYLNYCLQKQSCLTFEISKLTNQINDWEKKLNMAKERKNYLKRQLEQQKIQNSFASTHLQIKKIASKFL